MVINSIPGSSLTPAQIAYAVWRDAGCGTWRPLPSAILQIERKGWMVYVQLTTGVWPIPANRLREFAQQYEVQ